jgi:hypothetical protein
MSWGLKIREYVVRSHQSTLLRAHTRAYSTTIILEYVLRSEIVECRDTRVCLEVSPAKLDNSGSQIVTRALLICCQTQDSIQAILRLYQGSIKALLRLKLSLEPFWYAAQKTWMSFLFSKLFSRKRKYGLVDRSWEDACEISGNRITHTHTHLHFCIWK